MGLPSGIKNQLESYLDEAIVRVAPLGGGCISSAAVIQGESGSCLFCKWNSSAPVGFFSAEAAGLRALGACGVLKVPKVLCLDDSPASGLPFIALEFLYPGQATAKANRDLGAQLAELHKQTQESCGFDEDNFIGSLEQQNPIESSWSEFFFTHRLCVQARIGGESGWFDYHFERLMGEKEQRIRDALDADQDPPCLLHGDLWSGNVFWSTSGPVLIDPAVYWGSREADIAFTELFGRFDSAFYKSYNEVYPLQDGYQQRKQILNLYHLMTHSNLFGGQYISSAYSALTKI